MSQAVPQNILFIYTMTAQLLNGQGPNAWENVYWDVYNEADLTGQYSGYQGQLQNIQISTVTQVSSTTNQMVVPTSPAGGDLTGLYPNPTLAEIQGNPISNLGTLGSVQDGYVLSWNGTQFVLVPSIADGGNAGGDLSGTYPNPTVAALQHNPVAAGTPADGYVLTWNGTEWIGAVSAEGFIAGGDLSGTATDQIVIGLQTYALANTIPVSKAVPIYDTTNVHYDIRQLTMDDIAAGFAITGFTGGSTVEIGVTVTNPAFTASYNTTPTSANITNTDAVDSPLTLITPFTSGTVVGSFHHTTQTSVTFTLTAVGTSTQTANSFIVYDPRSFGGVGTAGATATVTASGNNAVLSTGDTINNLGLFSSDTGQTFGPFSPSGQVIYLLLTGGSHTFKDANTGFAFPMNSPTSVTFTNQHSAMVSMYLYQSENVLSATYSILVAT